jgi:hypothetical protein
MMRCHNVFSVKDVAQSSIYILERSLRMDKNGQKTIDLVPTKASIYQQGKNGGWFKTFQKPLN